MQGNENKDNTVSERQGWMRALAVADWQDLSALADAASLPDSFEILRHPEPGLVMVRARMGGTGQPFNAGEATVTRCTVRSGNGTTGHAYVMGRNSDHALCAARLDAALQDPDQNAHLMRAVIAPLQRRSEEKKTLHQRKTAATKVDFFTLVRGEDD